MFRSMRRNRQQLSKEETESIFLRGTSGVLALSGDDGYPYAVPLSYLYENGKLYFHCAKAGHKLDSVRRNPKASFCVIDRDLVVPEKFTTLFRSAIAFGTVREIENADEKRAVVFRLAKKYAPLVPDDTIFGEIERECEPLCMLTLTVEHMSGKECIELVREREQK